MWIHCVDLWLYSHVHMNHLYDRMIPKLMYCIEMYINIHLCIVYARLACLSIIPRCWLHPQDLPVHDTCQQLYIPESSFQVASIHVHMRSSMSDVLNIWVHVTHRVLWHGHVRLGVSSPCNVFDQCSCIHALYVRCSSRHSVRFMSQNLHPWSSQQHRTWAYFLGPLSACTSA